MSRAGGPTGGGSLVFPKVPQSSLLGILRVPQLPPPLEHPPPLKNPTNLDTQTKVVNGLFQGNFAGCWGVPISETHSSCARPFIKMWNIKCESQSWQPCKIFIPPIHHLHDI